MKVIKQKETTNSMITLYSPGRGAGYFLEITDKETGVNYRWAISQEELDGLKELLGLKIEEIGTINRLITEIEPEDMRLSNELIGIRFRNFINKYW